MKKELLVDFYKSMLHSEQIQSDDFFSNEIVHKAKNLSRDDYDVFCRQRSLDEAGVITSEAFNLLLFWIKTGEITIDFFERFMTILTSFSEYIFMAVDEESLPGMVEMMSLVDFKDYVIYTTIEIFIDSPDLLRRQFDLIH